MSSGPKEVLIIEDDNEKLDVLAGRATIGLTCVNWVAVGVTKLGDCANAGARPVVNSVARRPSLLNG
jgi:hypothetical protein